MPHDGIDPSDLWRALVRGMPWRTLIVAGDGTVIDGSCASARRYADGRHANLMGRHLSELVGSLTAHAWLARAGGVRVGDRIVVDASIAGVLERVVITVLGTDELGSTLLLAMREAAEPMDAISIAEQTTIGDVPLLAQLTPREREILGLIGDGMTTGQIAERLERSTKTVEWHRVSIGRKLRIKTRVGLTHLALRAGLSRARVPESADS